MLKFGFNAQGFQRYRCKQCGKTFSDIPERPLDSLRVPLDKAAQILNMLVEGMGIRSCERLTGVHRDTILNILETAGHKCARFHEQHVKGVRVNSVQVDECWTRVRVIGKNAKHDEEGDQYVLLAMCSETKLIASYLVGKRDNDSALNLMRGLRSSIKGRFQLSTDAFRGFKSAIGRVFYNTIDYGRIIKKYVNPAGDIQERRYSPPAVVGVRREEVFGTPYPKQISTSHIERQNLNVRHFNKRFARLTLGYSKKLQNLKHAVALYVAHHNYCRIHASLNGKTPAMASNLTDHVWTISELLSAQSLTETSTQN